MNNYNENSLQQPLHERTHARSMGWKMETESNNREERKKKRNNVIAINWFYTLFRYEFVAGCEKEEEKKY